MIVPNPLSYLSPKAAVQNSPIHGRGLFAIGEFQPGEIVCVKGGYIFNREVLAEIAPVLGPVEIQIADGLFIGPRQAEEREGGMIFSNHSCDPNIGVEGQIVFVALRRIEAGEELTHDWATTDDDDYSMTCRCGAPCCRGVITGQDWRRKDLQQKYRGYFAWHLQHKIDAGRTPHFVPNLQEQFGPIDIYLFDQLLRGRLTREMRICDAGCGSGRNLVYFFQEGFEVFGADADPRAIQAVRQMARALAPDLPADNFRAESIEAMSFADAFADVAISSAVLHFARDEAHFEAMLRGTWRVLKPGGLFFCRLASSIGIESQVKRSAGRRFALPDGSERFLVDGALLMKLSQELGGELIDPLKTTVVQNQRSMTTWVLRKD
jgi:tellurite methyltransferase